MPCLEKRLTDAYSVNEQMAVSHHTRPSYLAFRVIEVPIMCHILFQELEIQQHRQKDSGLMERQYILVGRGGIKQDKILVNYMLYEKVMGTLGKQEKGDCSVRLGQVVMLYKATREASAGASRSLI